jgi:hypothetical protein
VLYLSAPTAALDEGNMQRFFGEDAVRIWPVTKGEKLVSLVSERNSKVEELESAEMSLILNVNKEVGKSHNRNIKYEQLPKQMKKSLRPTHKSKTPVVGKEVDSISFFRDQIREKEDDIEKARESNETAESLGGAAAVFVEFRTQPAAQRAYQQIASSDILSLTPRFVGTMPNEVIWANLNLAPARRISQSGVAVTLVIATIAFWSIPVGIVGALSNVEYLAENFKWLAFLNRLPSGLMSLLSGLLPPLVLSALARYVPNIFRCKCPSLVDSTTCWLTQYRHLYEVRRADQDCYRAEGAKVVLRFSSAASLSCYNTGFGCCCSSIADRQGPKRGTSATRGASTKSVKHLPRVLHRPGIDQCPE